MAGLVTSMRLWGRSSCLSCAKPRAHISGSRRNGALFHFPGRVAEWFKAAVLKIGPAHYNHSRLMSVYSDLRPSPRPIFQAISIPDSVSCTVRVQTWVQGATPERCEIAIRTMKHSRLAYTPAGHEADYAPMSPEPARRAARTAAHLLCSERHGGDQYVRVEHVPRTRVAAIACAVVCELYEDRMKRKANLAVVTDASQRRPPVRVRSRRLTADSAKLYPPDGQEKVWWDRLKKALGTGSSDFVNASLHQLQAAAQFPGSGICEVGINAALAFIEGFAPRNEVEAALAVQMACTHMATMAVLGRLGPAGGTQDHVLDLRLLLPGLRGPSLPNSRLIVVYVTGVTSTSAWSMCILTREGRP